MLADELYRRALATLVEVESLHVHSRSVNYPSLDLPPQCAVVRRCVHFHAPDRIWYTAVGCNPVAVRERSDLIQVGERAVHRQPTPKGGAWARTKPVLEMPDDLPALITGWMALPSTSPTVGGVFGTTAFLLPTVTTIRWDGCAHPTIAFPVETQRHPRLYFPGDPPARGGTTASVSYRGEYQHPARIIQDGTLFVDARDARPLRYLAITRASMDDGETVLLDHTHVRFRCRSDTVIEMPSPAGVS